MPLLGYTYDFAQLLNTPEDWNKAQTSFNEIRAIVNALDGSNVQDNALSQEKLIQALREHLGVNGGGQTRRGKSIIATEETRNNTAFGTMTTPDQVQNVVLPSDGLLVVAFQALVKSSVGSAGRVGIFVGANQQKSHTGAAAPITSDGGSNSTANVYAPVASYWGGLTGTSGYGVDASDVTTGQSIGLAAGGNSFGGPAYIFAAAGTYTVSVQFKASSGTVTAKERKLWVWGTGF